MLRLEPRYLELDMGGTKQRAPGLCRFREGILRGSYGEYAPDCFGRRGAEPRFALRPGENTEYLGAGLGARSRFDGFYTENITDLSAYIAASAYYEHIIKRYARIPSRDERAG